jgi:phage-related protein
MAITLADAFIRIRPKLESVFKAELVQELHASGGAAGNVGGDAAGKAFARAFPPFVKAATASLKAELGSDAEKAGAEAGRRAGDSLTRRLNETLAALHIPAIDLNVDSATAARKIHEVELQLDELSRKGATAQIRLDATRATADAARLSKTLGFNVEAKVDLDTNRASSEIARLGGSTSRLKGLFGALPGSWLAMGAAAVVASPFILMLASSIGLAAAASASVIPAAIGAGTAVLALKGAVTDSLAAFKLYQHAQLGSAAATDKFNAAMAKLSPAGRAFVTELISINTQVTGFKRRLETATLPGFTTFLKDARGAGNLLGDSMVRLGSTIGLAAQRAGEFVKSKQFLNDLNPILRNNEKAFAFFGQAGLNAFKAIMDIGATASPMLVQLARWVTRVTEGFSDWIHVKQTTGELAAFFQKAAAEAAKWGSILSHFASGVLNLLVSANAPGRDLASSLEQVAKNFDQWTKVNTGKVQEFLQKIKDFDWAALGRAIANIAGAFVDISKNLGGVALNPLIALLQLVGENKTATYLLVDAWIAFKLATALGVVLQGITTGLWLLGTALESATIQQWALNIAMDANIIGIIVIAVAALATGIYFLATKTQFFETVWHGLQVAFTAVKDALVVAWHAVVDAAVTAWGAIVSAVQTAWSAIKGVFDAVVSFVSGVFTTTFNAFRTVVEVVWTAIQTATTTTWGIVKAVFGPIVGFLRDVFGPGFVTFASIVKAVWSVIAITIQTNWATIKAVFHVIVGFLSGLFTATWRALKAVIDTVWLGIRIAVNAAWGFIKGIFDAIVAHLRGPLTTAWRAFKSLIDTVWLGIRIAVNAAWGFIKSVFDATIGHLKGPLTAAWRGIRTAIEAVWTGIRVAATSGWNFLRDKVFAPLASIIKNGVPEAFRAGAKAIGAAWATIKKLAEAPVDFVVKTVINNGIIAGANSLLRAVGAKTITPVAWPPPGWARGGVLPGFTPGRDVHRFTSPTGGALDLSGGEAIMRPEFTRGVGSAAINTWNWIARTKGDFSVHDLLNTIGGDPGGVTPRAVNKALSGRSRHGYALGGILPSPGDLWDSTKKLFKFASDPIKAVVQTPVNALLSKVPGTGSIRDAGIGAVRTVLSGALTWLKDKIKNFFDIGGGGAFPVPGNLKTQVALAKKWLHSAEGTPYVYGGFSPGGFDCSAAISAVYNILHGKGPFSGTRFTTANEANYMSVPGASMFFAKWINGGIDVAHTKGVIDGLKFEQTPPFMRVGKHVTPDSYFDHTGHPPGMARGGILEKTRRFDSPGLRNMRVFDRGGSLYPGPNLVTNETGYREDLVPVGQAGINYSPTFNVPAPVNVTELSREATRRLVFALKVGGGI